MGRGAESRRLIAVSGGVLINSLILAALVLVEQAPPRVEDAPVLLVELERPQKHKAERRVSSALGGVASASRPRAAASRPEASEAASAVAPIETPPPDIDPAWRMDPRVVDRWRLQESGRYQRACSGLSNEHMTEEEKARCYGGWYNKPTDKRPSPNFIGPIDNRKWEYFERPPPPPNDKEFQRHERCKAYRGGRVGADASSMPSLREGGCF